MSSHDRATSASIAKGIKNQKISVYYSAFPVTTNQFRQHRQGLIAQHIKYNSIQDRKEHFTTKHYKPLTVLFETAPKNETSDHDTKY